MSLRAILKISAVIFLVGGWATGQDPDPEVAILRELLGVSPSTVIEPSVSSPLPPALKVYVVAGKNPKTREAFVKQINKWNEKEASEYGSISLVQTVSEANVILVQYELRLNKNLEGPPPVGMVTVRSFSYLIVREPERLAVVWRKMFEGYRDPSRTPGVSSSLREELFRRIKTQANKDTTQRESKKRRPRR